MALTIVRAISYLSDVYIGVDGSNIHSLAAGKASADQGKDPRDGSSAFCCSRRRPAEGDPFRLDTIHFLRKENGEVFEKQYPNDMEPVFGFLKANLHFIRKPVRGKEQVNNELGFAFDDSELEKVHRWGSIINRFMFNTKGSDYQITIIGTFFYFFNEIVLSRSFFKRFKKDFMKSIQ